MDGPTPYWIAFGDVHGHTANIARIPGLAGAAGVIVSGDLTVRGGPREAKRITAAITAVNPRVLAQIGNMDHASVQDWLDEKGMGIHARAVELAPGLGLIGVGWSGPTPFGTPSEASDEQIGRWLRQTHAVAGGFRHLVLVSHSPPKDTLTDMVGEGVHVGSAAVRAFIEEFRPDVCITGHIHESRAVDTIGETVVVNPGDLASGGYVRLDWDGEKVRVSLEMLGATPGEAPGGGRQ